MGRHTKRSATATRMGPLVAIGAAATALVVAPATAGAEPAAPALANAATSPIVQATPFAAGRPVTCGPPECSAPLPSGGRLVITLWTHTHHLDQVFGFIPGDRGKSKVWLDRSTDGGTTRDGPLHEGRSKTHEVYHRGQGWWRACTDKTGRAVCTAWMNLNRAY